MRPGRRQSRRYRLGPGVVLERDAPLALASLDWLDVDHAETGLLEEVVHPAAVEELEMGVVEQACDGVWKAPLQQRDARAEVGDVGQRDHHRTAFAQVGDGSAQGAERVLQVLEHVGGDDHVEVVIPELREQLWVVEVADNHRLAASCR